MIFTHSLHLRLLFVGLYSEQAGVLEGVNNVFQNSKDISKSVIRKRMTFQIHAQ